MTSTGFTVVMCQTQGCGTALALMPALRAVVRSTRHGVLISTGCTLGPLTCRSRAGGAVVLVQPCDIDRRPIGPAVHVGPLRTRSDVADLVAWLRTGDLDPDDLPWWLRLDSARHAAAHN